MGFDVSFHPISPAEMDMWYFTPLECCLLYTSLLLRQR